MTRNLHESELAADPFAQFRRWFDDATTAGLEMPEAMGLSTVFSGRPSSRMVLLKGIDTGFVFFTNYKSRKSLESAEDARAALLFHWIPLERQVRIEGIVERVSASESDAYFATRPRGSQIGAWASPQSQVIPSREPLEEAAETITARFRNSEIPRPPFWGGFRVIPDSVEFWQGRQDRLHDRLRYRMEDEGWIVERLAP